MNDLQPWQKELVEKYEDEWLDDGRRIYVDAELEALAKAKEQA